MSVSTRRCRAVPREHIPGWDGRFPRVELSASGRSETCGRSGIGWSTILARATRKSALRTTIPTEPEHARPVTYKTLKTLFVLVSIAQVTAVSAILWWMARLLGH